MEKNFDKYTKQRLKDMGLDLKDQKILDLLRLNCRFNNTEIGKMVGLSKESVGYRIRKLWEKEIILGEYTYINSRLIGMNRFYFLIKFNDFSKSFKTRLISHIKSLKYFRSYTTFMGEYDFAIMVEVNDDQELKYLCDKLKSICGSNILRLDILIGIEEEKLSLFFEKIKPNLKKYSKSSFQKYFNEGKKELIKLDALDRKIIAIMQNNASISLREISDNLKISINTVYERIKKMILGDIIVGFKIRTLARKMGLEYYRILFAFKKLDHEIEKKFEDYIKKINFLSGIERYVGDWDYALGFKFSGSTELNEFLEDVRINFKDNIQRISILSYGGDNDLRFKYK